MLHKFTERILNITEAIEADQGIVQPCVSTWASPVVVVPKKDGTLCFCIDYSCLGAITRRDINPLPDILDTLENAKYFSIYP